MTPAARAARPTTASRTTGRRSAANGDDDDGDEQTDYPADDGCTSDGRQRVRRRGTRPGVLERRGRRRRRPRRRRGRRLRVGDPTWTRARRAAAPRGHEPGRRRGLRARGLPGERRELRDPQHRRHPVRGRPRTTAAARARTTAAGRVTPPRRPGPRSRDAQGRRRRAGRPQLPADRLQVLLGGDRSTSDSVQRRVRRRARPVRLHASTTDSTVSAPHNFAFDTGGGLDQRQHRVLLRERSGRDDLRRRHGEAAGLDADLAGRPLGLPLRLRRGRPHPRFGGVHRRDAAHRRPGDACASGASADITAPVGRSLLARERQLVERHDARSTAAARAPRRATREP